MQPVILDTDVASLLHRRKLTGPLATRLIGRDPLITFVTFGELTKWAEIRHWGPHRPRPVNDMWIAACSLTYDVPLATLNLKDYEDFTEHHGLRILGTR